MINRKRFRRFAAKANIPISPAKVTPLIGRELALNKCAALVLSVFFSNPVIWIVFSANRSVLVNLFIVLFTLPEYLLAFFASFSIGLGKVWVLPLLSLF